MCCGVLTPLMVAAQATRANASFVAIDGGHFFLHEDLERADALVREHLE